MFDCVVTVNGDGHGRNGQFKEDKTGPVSQFMVDNVVLYPLVKNHIVQCPHCDPTKAVRHYLERRKTLKKFKGRVTATLAKVALSYERKCAKTRPVPRELVNEFIWRSGDPDLILSYEKRLSIEESVWAARFYLEDLKRYSIPMGYLTDVIPKTSRLFIVCNLLTHGAPPKTELELKDLIQVAGVMLT
jgi:hypothetical protein